MYIFDKISSQVRDYGGLSKLGIKTGQDFGILGNEQGSPYGFGTKINIVTFSVYFYDGVHFHQTAFFMVGLDRGGIGNQNIRIPYLKRFGDPHGYKIGPKWTNFVAI